MREKKYNACICNCLFVIKFNIYLKCVHVRKCCNKFAYISISVCVYVDTECGKIFRSNHTFVLFYFQINLCMNLCLYVCSMYTLGRCIKL